MLEIFSKSVIIRAAEEVVGRVRKEVHGGRMK